MNHVGVKLPPCQPHCVANMVSHHVSHHVSYHVKHTQAPPKNIFKFGPPQGRSHQRMKRCEAARATVKQTLQLARGAGKANYRTRGGATAGTVSVANHQLETSAGGQNTPGTQASMQAWEGTSTRCCTRCCRYDSGAGVINVSTQ